MGSAEDEYEKGVHDSQQQPNVGWVNVEQMAQSLSSEPQLCPGSSSIQPITFKAPMCTLFVWAIRQKFVCTALENETSVKCTLWERAF